jgi:hypothetical protein
VGSPLAFIQLITSGEGGMLFARWLSFRSIKQLRGNIRPIEDEPRRGSESVQFDRDYGSKMPCLPSKST